jgi:hypothetical protein
MKNFFPPLVALILAAAAIGAYTYVIGDISTNIAKADEAESGVATLSARDATARSMEFLLQGTADQSAAIAVFVIPDADVASPIAIVEDAARLAHVKTSISGIAVTSPDGWVHHQGIEVSFSVTGPFASLTRFATILESLPVGAHLEASSYEASKDAWFGTFRVVFIKAKP